MTAENTFEFNGEPYRQLETQIIERFDHIVLLVQNRKEELLRVVSKIENKSRGKFEKKLQKIKDMHVLCKEVSNCDLKDEEIIQTRDDQVENLQLDIQLEMGDLNFNTSSYSFGCEMNNLMSIIHDFGYIHKGSNDLIPKYRTVGTQGMGPLQFDTPTMLNFCPSKDQLYVCDSGNVRVQVLSSNFSFLREFGNSILTNPKGVVATSSNVYVSDCNKLLRFKCEDLSLLKVVDSTQDGPLNGPLGIDTDASSNVWVSEELNSRVVVFSHCLQFKFYVGMRILRLPQDLCVYGDRLFVVDRGEFLVHVFSLTGDILNSFVSIENSGGTLGICVDPMCNIIICDGQRKKISIFTCEGEEIYHVLCSDSPFGVIATGINEFICTMEQTGLLRIYPYMV